MSVLKTLLLVTFVGLIICLSIPIELPENTILWIKIIKTIQNLIPWCMWSFVGFFMTRPYKTMIKDDIIRSLDCLEMKYFKNRIYDIIDKENSNLIHKIKYVLSNVFSIEYPTKYKLRNEIILRMILDMYRNTTMYSDDAYPIKKDIQHIQNLNRWLIPTRHYIDVKTPNLSSEDSEKYKDCIFIGKVRKIKPNEPLEYTFNAY